MTGRGRDVEPVTYVPAEQAIEDYEETDLEEEGQHCNH